MSIARQAGKLSRAEIVSNENETAYRLQLTDIYEIITQTAFFPPTIFIKKAASYKEFFSAETKILFDNLVAANTANVTPASSNLIPSRYSASNPTLFGGYTPEDLRAANRSSNTLSSTASTGNNTSRPSDIGASAIQKRY
jgi:hypothetical protein